MTADILWRVKCHAHTSPKRGRKPCSNWAIRGGYVCRLHGGSIQRVKRKALERLVELMLAREAERQRQHPGTPIPARTKMWLKNPH